MKKNNIDHLGNIHKWLQDMRLHNRYPSEKKVKNRIYSLNFKIEQTKFDDAKQKIFEILETK